MVQSAGRSDAVSTSFSCGVFAGTALQPAFWVSTEAGKNLSARTGSYFATGSNSIIFLPRLGSSFGFIALPFLRITCKCLRVLSPACEIVEARGDTIRIVCVGVISVPPGANRVRAVCYQADFWNLQVQCWTRDPLGAGGLCVAGDGRFDLAAVCPSVLPQERAPDALALACAVLHLLHEEGALPAFRSCKKLWFCCKILWFCGLNCRRRQEALGIFDRGGWHGRARCRSRSPPRRRAGGAARRPPRPRPPAPSRAPEAAPAPPPAAADVRAQPGAVAAGRGRAGAGCPAR